MVYVGLRPSDYWALTVMERDAILTAYNKKNRS